MSREEFISQNRIGRRHTDVIPGGTPPNPLDYGEFAAAFIEDCLSQFVHFFQKVNFLLVKCVLYYLNCFLNWFFFGESPQIVKRFLTVFKNIFTFL